MRLPSKGSCPRFHYRGVGNSGGNPSALDVPSMTDDALIVAEHIRSEFGVTNLVFVGTRLAGAAAAAAAAETPANGLVLWDPVLDPRRYFKDVFRSRLLAELRSGGGGTTSQLLDELLSTGSVEVLGFSIGRRIYDSALASPLAETVARSSGPVLAVEFNRRNESPGDIAGVGSQLRLDRGEVENQGFRHNEAWWFADNVSRFDHTGRESAPLIQMTSQWTANLFASAAVAS